MKMGTGFFISASGELATNFHVIEGGKSFKAQTQTGAFYAISRVLAADRERDVAILKADAENAPCLSLSSGIPQIGESIVIVGSPKGLDGSVSNGILSAVRNVENVDVLQFTAPISHGSSGSPVLNAKAEVIGIATASIASGQNLNFAIPASVISSLARQTGNESSTPAYAGAAPTAAHQNDAPQTDPVFAQAVENINTHGNSAITLQLLDNVARRFPNSASVQFLLATTYVSLAMYKDAAACDRKSVALAPGNPDFWNHLSFTLTLLRQFNGAKDAAEQAIKLDPISEDGWQSRGWCFLKLKDYASAEADFKRGVELNPKSQIGWEGLALVYSGLGRTADASYAKKRAKTLSPRAPISLAGGDPDAGAEGNPFVNSNNNSPGAPNTEKYFVTGLSPKEQLSVRTGPGTKYEILTKLPNNYNQIRIAGSPVMSENTQWVHIECSESNGWVRSKYLRKQE